MVELGSVLPTAGDGPRGPDLRVQVRVPRRALGSADGFDASVPDEIMVDGVAVRRVPSPHDPTGKVHLQLPSALAFGAVLRLRGQGGAREDCPPGDLFVEIHVVEVPGPTGRSYAPLVLALATAAAVATWFLSR